MGRVVILILLAAATWAGCKRSDPSPGPAGAPPETATMPRSPRGPMPSAESAAPVTIPDTGNPEATLQQLSTELRNYVIRTRSVPKNFDEFAAKAGVQFPPPPAGKKYVIKGQAVVLQRK